MDIFIFFRPLILLCIFAAAAVTDAAHHKVYNSLLLTGFVGQSLTHWLYPGPVDVISLCYSISFIALTVVLFYMHCMGGADVKLYMLTVYSYPNVTGERIIALSIILGAVCSLMILGRQVVKGTALQNRKSVKLPMGIFVFAGASIVLLLGL